MRHLALLTALLALAAPAAAEPLDAAAARARLAPFTVTPPGGQPLDGATLQQIARAVRTDPGDLPRLKVKAGDAQLDLPLKHTHVFADLTGYVARVDVVQTYTNPFDRPIEAIYVFPLPENAAVDDMKIRIGARVIEADIQKRAEARKTYEDAKKQGHTAALLEQERPNIFTQSVANIAPGESIDVTLRYVQQLTYDGGEFEFVFPMVVGPRFVPGSPTGKKGSGWSVDTDEVPDASRITPPILGAGVRSGHDISVEVLLEGGDLLTDLTTPTHAVDARIDDDGLVRVQLTDAATVPNRDFVMRYRLDGEVPRAQVFDHFDHRGGFFSLVLHPPRADLDALVGQREVVFVIDVSGSMSGVPLGIAKDVVRRAVTQLGPDDTFNVFTFAGTTARAFESPRPANDGNVKLGLQFVEAARAGGGTYLADAVEQALAPAPQGGRHRYVVFLTDGYVGNEAALFDRAEKLVKTHARGGHRARVFSLGTGSSVNRHLLDGLAKAGDGLMQVLTDVEDPALAVNRLYRVIDHPVISDVRVDWGGLDVSEVEPTMLPDLFATRPLVINGRFAKGGTDTVTVTGNRNGKPFSLEVPVTLHTQGRARGALPTLWARAQVTGLERRLWGGHDADAVAAIEKLGLEFRIVTAFTSFVAVDRSRTVGDGKPATVVQPVEAPAGVEVQSAAPAHAMFGAAAPASRMGSAMGDAVGVGGMGLVGTGQGGGGYGAGRVLGLGRVETGGGKGPARLSERSLKRPRLNAGQAVVSGSLDKRVILRVIRRHHGQIRYCYERALTKQPTLTGRLVLELVLDALGKVTKASVVEDSLKDTAVAECVTRQAARWRFPKAAGKITVRYPFAFAPGN